MLHTMSSTPSTPSLPSAGERAPDFCLPSTEGKDLSLSELLGKHEAVVVYFYSRDDTPGCTTEACSFHSLRDAFNAAGAEIVGINTDTVSSHNKFRTKYGLAFPLLADTDHAVAESYGVWQLKTFMGKEHMGIVRTTFVVGKDGRIKAVFPNVKVEGHADAVLEAVKG